jgi:hypothetical protein
MEQVSVFLIAAFRLANLSPIWCRTGQKGIEVTEGCQADAVV